MKKVVSFKLISESIEKLEQYKWTDMYDNLNLSIHYTSTLNESDLNKVNGLILFARNNGWYPTVTKQLDENINEELYESIVNIKKDELIWEYSMLVKESYILKEFGMDDEEYNTFRQELLSLKV